MNARQLLRRWGASDAVIDDLVDEFRHGGEGTLWREAALAWLQAQLVSLKPKRGAVLLAVALAAVYRLATWIPVPGIDTATLSELRESGGTESLFLWDLVTGNNMSRATALSLGVVPYVQASVWVHVGFAIWRAFIGKRARHIAQATGMFAIVLCVLQARGHALFLEELSDGTFPPLVADPGWAFEAVAVATITAGTSLLIWVSDYITRRGIGNGMLITFIAAIINGLTNVDPRLRSQPVTLLVVLAVAVAAAGWVSRGYRRSLLDATAD